MRQGWINLMASVSLIALDAAVDWDRAAARGRTLQEARANYRSVVGRRSSVEGAR